MREEVEMVSTHIVFLPGEVSLDVVEALELAIEKIRSQKDLLLRVPGQLAANKRKIVRASNYARLVPRTAHPVSYPTGSPGLEETQKEKALRVKRELIDAGVTLYGLLKAESRLLPKVLHPGEHVEAVVYGQHRSSSVMLVATTERIIFLDKKPMALFMDEVSYEVISGIEFEIHTLFATLILHTPVKNYDIRNANLRCAANFARHIEARRLKPDQEENNKQQTTVHMLPLPRPIHGPAGDMAGYYWLPTPTDEEEGR